MGQILCLGYLRGPKDRITIESFSLDSLSSGGTSIKFGIIQVTGNAPWIRIDEVDPFMDWQFTSDGIHIKTPKGLVCIDPSKIDEDVPLPSLDEGFFFSTMAGCIPWNMQATLDSFGISTLENTNCF